MTDYQFGEFLVEPFQNQISASGNPFALEPRTMDVLVYLIENKDRVVSSDELLEKLWPDRIVEESTIHRRINQLRNALGDSPTHSRYIKTVVKRGYQAVAEVSISENVHEKPAVRAAIAAQTHFRRATLGAVTLSLFIGLVFFLQPNDPNNLLEYSDSIPSIAVLPFTNMSEFSENEFFAAGIHEDLLTSLSGFSELAVISRTSVMRYADHDQSLVQIGEELNVDYVVEGSVRRQNQQVRISVQLIDARNDRHLWAMTYDRDLFDTFAVQSEITREVANQLSLELLNEDTEIYDIEIHDVLFKARELMRQRTSNSLAVAVASLRAVSSNHPENAEVHAAIGETLYLQSRANESWEDVAEESLRSLNLALTIDPDLSSARLALAQVQVWWLRNILAADLNYQAVILAEPNNADALMKYGVFLADARTMRDVAMPHLRRAVALNPYSGEAWSMLASNLMRAGNFEESYQVLMNGFAWVPDDYYLLRYQMEYFLYSGDSVEAMKHLLGIIRRDPNSLESIGNLAGLLNGLELHDEARLWLEEMIRINPEHSNTFSREAAQLRYEKDWQGLAGINARWEPLLGDYVKAPHRNWGLWSMQAEADQLWREGKTEQAQRIYADIAAFLIAARIPDRMGLTVIILGAARLEQGNMLAHALIRTGRVAEAEDLLIKITRNEGTGSAFAINRIKALAMLGKTDEAIEAFGKLLVPGNSAERLLESWAPGGSELGIIEFMDENTDWLNGVNRHPATIKVHEEYLARQVVVRNRVREEIPEFFDPEAFMQSARQQRSTN